MIDQMHVSNHYQKCIRLFAKHRPYVTSLILAGFIAGAQSISVTPAKAELKLCNTTSSRVGVAIGYRDKNRWATEGWWNVASNTCEVLLKGKLIARYYYIHAVDYDRGGEWSGKDTMCTVDKAFTVFGVKDCVKRGYKRTGFFEIDTKNEHDWTVRLKYPEENGKK